MTFLCVENRQVVLNISGGGGGSWGKGNLPPKVNVILAACEE